MPPGVRSPTDGVCPYTFRPVASVYHVRQLPRRNLLSLPDRRMRTWRRYTGSEAQKDADRIRKSGKLSSEHRQEINAKLAFFEGEAKDVYIREITPALSVAEQAERREKEANLAYYTSTRQSVLDRQAAEQAKQRGRGRALPPNPDVDAAVRIWSPGQQSEQSCARRSTICLSIRSEPSGKLGRRRLSTLPRRPLTGSVRGSFTKSGWWYWDERVAAGNLKMKEIRKRETQIDRAEFMKKLWRFEEGREYDALGPEYREAAANVAAGTLMFRTAVEASEFSPYMMSSAARHTLSRRLIKMC